MKKTADRSLRLQQGLQALGLPASMEAPLQTYLDELVKWNAAYSLTAVRDAADMVTRHLLDSLSVLAPLQARISQPWSLLDVGSGAGLPGLPLALACPYWRVTVLDSNGKKARFLRHAQRTLALSNVAVVEARVEAHEPAAPYDAVISRAFSALGEFVARTDHLVARDGCWLAMRGRLDDNPVASLPLGVDLQQTTPLHVPGLAEERHLLILSRSAARTSRRS